MLTWLYKQSLMVEGSGCSDSVITQIPEQHFVDVTMYAFETVLLRLAVRSQRYSAEFLCLGRVYL